MITYNKKCFYTGGDLGFLGDLVSIKVCDNTVFYSLVGGELGKY